MRPRTEIEQASAKDIRNSEATIVLNLKLQLEVLLDIRDLLKRVS